MIQRSKLWKEILHRYAEDHNLERFRSSDGINSRLAAWNPKELSLRWHRSFLLLVSRNLSYDQLRLYQSFGNVSLGSPPEITYSRPSLGSRKIQINIDYLLSIFEVEFLRETFKQVNFPTAIFEVGAGFGRTCHSILSAHPETKRYVIIDFPEMIELSRTYLASILDEEQYSKTEFMEVGNNWSELEECELGIQINGLQEMDDTTIDFYMDEVFAKCKYFFSSNVVAKYLPEHAGINDASEETLETVLDLGRSRKVVDIWNLAELEEPRELHKQAYCPKGHRIINSKQNALFPHYEMTMYSATN